MNSTSGQMIILEAIQKAWSDPAYKGRLIHSPLEALEAISDASFKVPFDYTIQFVDRPDIDIVAQEDFQITEELPERVLQINIPSRPDVETLRLTDEQLEVIAAGGPGAGASPLIAHLLLPLILFPMR